MTTALQDTATDAAPAGAVSRPAELLLVRLLLPAKTPPKPAAVLKQLNAILPEPLSGEAFEALHGELAAAGLAEAGKLRPTDSGRAAALAVLGVDDLPAGVTWIALLDKYLVPAAATAGAADGAAPKSATPAELKKLLVRRHFGLGDNTGSTPAKMLEAAGLKQLCDELRLPETKDVKSLPAAVLKRSMGLPQELKGKSLETQVVRRVLGVANDSKQEFQRAMVRRWLAERRPPSRAEPRREAPTSPQPELSTFAAAAVRAAHESPSGWFGDNKVFIAHAWQQFRRQLGVPEMDLAAFKQRLVEANREGLLRLSRADLVSAMDPADVAQSEIRYLNAELHFILVEPADRPPGTEGVSR